MESVIPNPQELIPQSDSCSDISPKRFLVQVRFTALGVDMRVGAEKGHKCAGLIPSDQEFGGRVTKEPADVGCRWSARTMDGTLQHHGTDDEGKWRRADLPPQNDMPAILFDRSIAVSPAKCSARKSVRYLAVGSIAMLTYPMCPDCLRSKYCYTSVIQQRTIATVQKVSERDFHER